MENKSVGAEVAIVSPLAKITAVLGNAVNDYRVVCPLPNTASDEFRILVDKLPIIIKSTGRPKSVSVMVSAWMLGYRCASSSTVSWQSRDVMGTSVFTISKKSPPGILCPGA